jgi:hypothetical protein
MHRRTVSNAPQLSQQSKSDMASQAPKKRRTAGNGNGYCKKKTNRMMMMFLIVACLYLLLTSIVFENIPATNSTAESDSVGGEITNSVTQGKDSNRGNPVPVPVPVSITKTNDEKEGSHVVEKRVDKNDKVPPKHLEEDAEHHPPSVVKYNDRDEELKAEPIDPRDNNDEANTPEEIVESEKEAVEELVKEIVEKAVEESKEVHEEAEKDPWTPPDDEGLDPDHLPVNTTGAFANCTTNSLTTAPPHQDQHNITLSCHTLPYRIPQISSSEKIFIGVLSAAGGDGPERRQSIRETWAKNHSVYFLVAGPWKSIEGEYDEHQDLIWLDEDEIYDGEKSVLTYKTMALIKIVHHLSTSQNLEIKYAFKTDDDSFINVAYLHKYLLKMEHEDELNYWGWCQRKMFKPLRGENDKWAVSDKTYPEPRYPRYCQGAGFALSWKFISCAAGPGNHIANARFMPFEDVATGLIAQRCGIVPTMVEDPRLIHMYRTDSTEEKNRVNQGQEKISVKKLPIPDMWGRIVQHRIYGAWDMKEHFLQVLDPEGYKETTDIRWYHEEEAAQ